MTFIDIRVTFVINIITLRPLYMYIFFSLLTHLCFALYQILLILTHLNVKLKQLYF